MTTYEITFNERSAFGKNFLAFLEQNKKYVKVNDPTEMTKEEFYAKLEKARAQYEHGECKRISREDIRKLMGLE